MSLSFDDLYAHQLAKILAEGEKVDDRTGVGSLEVFGHSLELSNVKRRFPLLHLKEVRYKTAFDELCWMLRGETNTAGLASRLWDPWADETGDLGRTYGAQLRYARASQGAGPIDQVATLIDGLRHNPQSRRHMMTLWDPAELDQTPLPPCLTQMQANVSADGKHLDLHVYQRSADWFLGVPFDVAEWAAFMYIVEAATGLRPRSLRFSYGSTHLYLNQLDQAREVLDRYTSRATAWLGKPAATVRYRGPGPTTLVDWLDGLRPEHFEVKGYAPLGHIAARVAV